MGLACSQIRLLTLTARKADCEYGISIDSIRKMALSREQTQLSQEYNSKLKAKQISYYANGKYNKINYSYLMGYGANYLAITMNNQPLKTQNSMILTDYKGQVVLDSSYANAITEALGSSAMDSQGRGGTFSADQIPKILENLLLGNYGSYFTADFIKNIHDGGSIDSKYAASIVKTLTGESTGEETNVDNTKKATELVNKILDVYYPIFEAAAANGWTTEYNNDMKTNSDYVSDALSSGTFQLATVNDEGNYDPDTCLTYYVTSGLVAQNNDSEVREEVTAWYNEEKARISEKEDYLDLDINNLSTELESINTEIQSVKSLIDDAISSVFDWGSS